ncbi:head-tail adaptor protein [Oceanibium sediminis]|uniref:head-tail adaptor protein n=1 Tax=Oceanibium sediminis TaxID=2026339 RepID=UPI000DD312D6|nr:head-tail adaptor protein [Oceanibium sediminis]
MSAGRRRKLILEQRIEVPDGMGGVSHSWQALGQLWADMAPRRGREELVAERVSERVPWTISVRGAAAGSPQRPKPTQRFRDGTRVFNIISVAEADPAARYLLCSAEEGVAV